MNRVTFALFGSHGAGKTTLVIRLRNNTFVKCYRDKGTQGKLWSNIDIGANVKADIIEYSGSYHITENIIIPRVIHGIIVVFSVENRLSYKTAQATLSKISQYYKRHFCYMPILLYGTKIDASSDRKVTTDEVLAFLAENQYSNVKCKETSLKNDKQFIVNDIITAFNL